MTDSMDVAHALEHSNVLRVSVFGTRARRTQRAAALAACRAGSLAVAFFGARTYARACRTLPARRVSTADKEVLPVTSGTAAVMASDVRKLALASPARAASLKLALDDVRRTVDAALAILNDSAQGGATASTTATSAAADATGARKSGPSAGRPPHCCRCAVPVFSWVGMRHRALGRVGRAGHCLGLERRSGRRSPVQQQCRGTDAAASAVHRRHWYYMRVCAPPRDTAQLRSA